jgi:hypothetical protein
MYWSNRANNGCIALACAKALAGTIDLSTVTAKADFAPVDNKLRRENFVFCVIRFLSVVQTQTAIY